MKMEGLFMSYMTSVEISKIWNISPRRVSMLCADGRVEGAVKKGKTWLIPDSTVKPVDARCRQTKEVI